MAEKIKILVTPQAFSKVEFNPNELIGNNFQVDYTYEQLFEKDKLISKLSNVQGAVIGVEPITREVLEKCPNLKILSRFGVGYSSIDINVVKEKRVKVAVVPHSASRAVARHTVALVMALSHNIVDYARRDFDHLWDKKLNYNPEERTFGIIGLGNIGLEAAILLQQFGYKIAYYSREEKEEGVKRGFRYFNNVESLINHSDIVSLHLKSFPGSEGYLNAERLNLLKGKYFINTARGELVDEAKLYEFLSSGLIKGAALDVLATEPPAGLSKKLLSLPNVIVTPHVGVWDEGTINTMARSSIINIKNYFENNLSKIDKLIC